MKERFYYNLLAAGAALWCLLLVVPPLLMMQGTAYAPLSQAFYKSFSSICHQYDSHSLYLAGNKLAVCSRCSAIYFGFLGGVILFPAFSRKLFSKPLRMWLVACAPMVIDVALNNFGWHSSTPATRLITGGWFGAIAALILTPCFTEACMQIFHRKPYGAAYEPKT